MDCAILCLQSALEALEDEAAMMAHIRQARPEATDEDIRASIAISREHHETALEILKVYNGIERAVIQNVLENVVSKMEADALSSFEEIGSEEDDTPNRPPLEEYGENEAPSVSGFAGERLGYPEGPRLVDPKDKTSWN